MNCISGTGLNTATALSITSSFAVAMCSGWLRDADLAAACKVMSPKLWREQPVGAF